MKIARQGRGSNAPAMVGLVVAIGSSAGVRRAGQGLAQCLSTLKNGFVVGEEVRAAFSYIHSNGYTTWKRKSPDECLQTHDLYYSLKLSKLFIPPLSWLVLS